MSMEYLGQHFDIHTGGVDHIPVHHTNEIAQSEAYLADGRPWVGWWLHGEFINLRGAKISKSTGGGALVSDLIDRGYHPLTYRYLLLQAHYRSQTEFSWDAMSPKALATVAAAARDDSLDDGELAALAASSTRCSASGGVKQGGGKISPRRTSFAEGWLSSG